jgi:hypothetical protein
MSTRPMVGMLAIYLITSGCVARPLAGPPDGVEVTALDPMAIVWEQSYGMTRESRPDVILHDECRLDDHGAGQRRSVSISEGCVAAIVYETGMVELQMAAKPSDSLLAFALQEWKAFLLTSDFGPINGAEIKTARLALINAGF